ncbi:MAG TPA: ABC transporter permease [Noviherbaspirillum sp.]|nr:ABC transporter permease [Noviherbaspirillum sp.]
MVAALDRKLLRDMWRMRGQAVAIALVALCAIATFVMMRGAYEALMETRAVYYERYRFADVFAHVKRAPDTLLAQVREIPGVNEVHGRVVFQASLDVPGLDEPATGRLVSIPERLDEGLNRVFLRAGRAPQAGNRNEIIVSESFAQANKLQPGDSLLAVINARQERLHIVGIGLSPEYVSEIGEGVFPDNRRFGVMWMEHEALAAALDMRDAFNDLTLTLAPHGSEAEVIARLDILLAPYGTLGAYGRDDQVSHRFISDEMAQTRVSATVIPSIFLGVVAFLIHNVLLRLTTLQRAQIALLKSFGYSNFAVGAHYLKFALATTMTGGALGIAVGVWMGEGLAIRYAEFFKFPTFAFPLSAFSIAVSLLIAAASAVFGAALAVRRILRLPPAEAMRPESPARFRPGPLERMGLQRFIALPVRIILRNLERRPLKALMSVFGIALAVSLLVTGQFAFDALSEMVRLQFRVVQRDDVMVGFNEVRDRAAVHELASLPGVLRVEPVRNVPIELRAGHRMHKTALMALGPDPQLRRVVDEHELAVALPDDGIVLNAMLAELLAVRRGDHVFVSFLDGRRETLSARVAMIVEEPIGSFAYMDLAALARMRAEAETISGAFLAVDPAERATLYRTLKEVPAISSVNLREATIDSFMATVAENMRINTIVLTVFACVIAVGIVYNSARIALSEHALELASLRILGFTKNEACALLLGQQALITLAALPLGCLLGYGFAALIAALLSQETFRIPLVVSTETFVFSMSVVVAAAVGSGFLVWRRVQGLDLIEVLKTRE